MFCLLNTMCSKCFQENFKDIYELHWNYFGFPFRASEKRQHGQMRQSLKEKYESVVMTEGTSAM